MAKRKNETESEDGLTLTQLATRIPKDLHRVIKVFCVSHDTSVADFVTESLRHELEARRAEEREERAPKTVAKAAAKTVKAKTGKAKKAKRVLDDDDYFEDDDEDAA
jgi:hypothetical protein